MKVPGIILRSIDTKQQSIYHRFCPLSQLRVQYFALSPDEQIARSVSHRDASSWQHRGRASLRWRMRQIRAIRDFATDSIQPNVLYGTVRNRENFYRFSQANEFSRSLIQRNAPIRWFGDSGEFFKQEKAKHPVTAEAHAIEEEVANTHTGYAVRISTCSDYFLRQ
jgi:hypothetical protein